MVSALPVLLQWDCQEYEAECSVDNQRISVTQRQSVVDAIALRDAGKSGAEIKKILEGREI